ncbi:MAG: hypothetical protein UT34_C0001G0472 [candidate division WS6 bacterium GW2011_GWF2_39_15]|uniref:HTH deoR-type domain-containing protein n=1 Tax=candidate division WS6 bacterium GW2011_GWF2_39_15 TaxID=1619100 RepID=A0A0G0N0R0_9BACT|nr:MAG: hypothetical protein UT34_C0001G0472 [candidate division WS6 bacterium GW2011_GWF2_39_15]
MSERKSKGLGIILGIIGVGAVAYLLLKKKRSIEDRPSIHEEEALPRRNIRIVKKGADAGLNSRQKKLLDAISGSNGLNTMSMLKVVRNTTDRTLRRDLNRMMEMGLVYKQGSTKSSKYFAK